MNDITFPKCSIGNEVTDGVYLKVENSTKISVTFTCAALDRTLHSYQPGINGINRHDVGNHSHDE